MPDLFAVASAKRQISACWTRQLTGLLTLMLLTMVVAPLAAQEAPLVAEDPVLEARMLDIAKELRCLVCQNETIAESHADLALDLRQQIREQLRDGRTPQQIRDYMVARYGEFVLYRPPFSLRTVLLWIGPFVLLLIGFGVLWRLVRRRPQDEPPEETVLDAQAQQHARDLLGISDEPSSS